MAIGGIGKRYALALFDAAQADDVVEQVHDDVVGFGRLIDHDEAFARFLLSLRVTKEEKKQLITRAFGDRASGLFVKFACLLIETARMADYEEIARAFVELYEEHAGIVRVDVFSAVALDAELEGKTKETIERRTGKRARFVKHVDPAIIGGMIIVAGDRIIDGSVRSRLGELRKQLLETRKH